MLKKLYLKVKHTAMKRILLFMLLFTTIAGSAQVVNIPDNAFKAVLLASATDNGTAKNAMGAAIAIDANNDGEISEAEAADVAGLDVSGASIYALDGIAYFVNLETLDCSYNSLATLDVSANTALSDLTCSNNNLVTMFVKNGLNETFDAQAWAGNPNLEYICADESQVASIKSNVTLPVSVQVNSYCSYEPGGMYNRITGTIKFDAADDGCDAADAVAPSLKLKISAGGNEDCVFSKTDGTYTFYVSGGTYIVTPQFENAYFTASPPAANAVFIGFDGAVSINDFCISANGPHTDVEVVIAPLNDARPGQNARYKMVYKNKGNQVIPFGTVTCNWDSAKFDFISMSPMANGIGADVYVWNYTNLMPFEVREIVMELKVNNTTENPAVNVDDILSFGMTIVPGTDDLTDDNTFQFNQVVKDAAVSNSIECIQGAAQAPESIGEYLHYIVNFENTGNAPADFIVIEQDFDPNEFELSTLRLINSSQAVSTRVMGNRVTFRLDENMSVAEHGNILYKIKSKTSLIAGNTVTATANIYYQYNNPVTTNATTTVFEVLSSGDFEKDNTVKVYPNPSRGNVTIEAQAGIESVELYDIQGRLLQRSFTKGEAVQFDMSQRAAGIYLMRIVTEKGIKVEKVVRE